jgi:hypothetical protein
MECIICKDLGSEPIQNNTHCNCKYKYHSSCWIDYIHSKNKLTCPLCRIDISNKSLPKPTSNTPLIQATAPPYAVQNTSPGQQISYQEFIVIIEQYNTAVEVQSTPLQPLSQSPKNLSMSQKILKVIVGICILAIIVTVFTIIMNLT